MINHARLLGRFLRYVQIDTTADESAKSYPSSSGQLVLGKLLADELREIGEMTGQFHDEIGGYAKSQGIDRLFAFGESSLLAARNFGAGGTHYKKLEDLIEALLPELTPDSTVLVKGSRFMRMERVADAVAAAAQTTPPENT